VRRASLLLATFACLSSVTAAQGKFSVPAPRAASATAAEANDALQRGDLAQAAASLAELLDTEPGTLIQLGTDESEPWIGATKWARDQASSGPVELRARLAKMREAEAAAALARARTPHPGATAPNRALDFATITHVYPGTQAAFEAGVRLGDLAFEAGQGKAARTTWSDTLALVDPNSDLAAALALRLAQVPDAMHLDTTAPKPPPLLEGSWTVALPDSLRDTYVDYAGLWPVAEAGRVFVNTGLSVLAIDATTGLLIWDSGEPAGWEQLSGWKRRELSRGVGHEDLISRVATNGRIVVAAQQLPFTEAENDQINGMTITVALPERRLFAFDAQTGTPLWNHTPTASPALAIMGAAALPYEQRARISAPPLIVDDLVLVPSYELVGRINLHVSAYDLYTGAPVWDRLLISGQTRVNLFGEHEVEFNSAPLVLDGDNVIVATGLGVISSLDLTTGEPAWSQDYMRFELPKTNGYFTPRTTRRWHNTAPVVAEDRIYVTPADSPDLIALDRKTGKLELELDGTDLEDLAETGIDDQVRLDHLVAVDDGIAWLGGDAIAAFELAPLRLRFMPISTPNTLSSYTGPAPHPRVLATANNGPLLAATVYGVLSVDRTTGLATDLGPLDPEAWAPGNLGLASGRLLVLGDDFLSGWVSWDSVIAEGEQALAQTTDPERQLELRIELASAYLARASAYTTPTEDLAAARRLLLAKSLEHSADARLTHLRYSLFDQEGRALAQTDSKVAYQRFLQAKELATSIEEQLTALLGAFEALGIPDAAQPESGWRSKSRDELLRMLAGDLAREVIPDELSADLYDEVPSVLARLDPTLTSFAETLGASALTRVPVGYLASLALGAKRVRAGDLEAGLMAWHKALWDFGELKVSTPTGKLTLSGPALERIEQLLATQQGGKAYASFEAAADAQLECSAQATAGERADLLAGILRRWPQSQAADQARVSILDAEIARLQLDVGNLADLAAAAIPLTARQDSARVRAFLALAQGAALAGNVELAQLFATRLVELAPDEPGARSLIKPTNTTPLPFGNRRAFRGPASTAEGLAAVRLGSFTPIFPVNLNEADDATGAGELLLVAGTNGDLLAFEADGKGAIRWTFPGGGYSSASWGKRAAALPADTARIITVISTSGVEGIDPTTGYLTWSRSPQSLRPVSLIGAGGLVCVEWTDASGNRTVEGLDAFGGALLWSHTLPKSFASRVEGLRLMLAGTRLVVMGRGTGSDAVVLDATTGARLGDLAMGKGTSSGDREAAWSQGSRFCVPRLLAGTGGRPNVLDVFDLNALFSSAPTPPSFSLSLGRDQETAGVIHSPAGHYMWMIGVGPSRDNSSGDTLVEVDAALGALRQVSRLQKGERPLGLELGGSLHLDADMLLVATSPGAPVTGKNLTVRGIALPLGPLWSLEITAPTDPRWSLYDGPMPAAVLGRSSIAFVYALNGAHASMGQELHMLIVDRKAGSIEQDRVLVSRLGRISGLSLEGVGAELFLFGRGNTAGRGRLEVLESRTR